MKDKLSGDLARLRGEVGKKSKRRKTKIAVVSGTACGGCELSLMGGPHVFPEILEFVEIVYWPMLKEADSDIENLPDKSIDLCFYSGSPATEKQREQVRLFRKKSRNLVCLGSCAYLGGIAGLLGTGAEEAVLKTKYVESNSLAAKGFKVPREKTEAPEGDVILPEAPGDIKSLTSLVEADYVIAGCPPRAEVLEAFLLDFFSGKKIKKGIISSGAKTVCSECPRKRKAAKIKTIVSRAKDPEKCLLDQGVLCMGPVTRTGCEARCPGVNAPCRGCMGPAEGESDSGASYSRLLSGLMDKEGAEKIRDYVGTTYRFSLKSSILKK